MGAEFEKINKDMIAEKNLSNFTDLKSISNALQGDSLLEQYISDLDKDIKIDFRVQDEKIITPKRWFHPNKENMKYVNTICEQDGNMVSALSIRDEGCFQCFKFVNYENNEHTTVKKIILCNVNNKLFEPYNVKIE